MIEINNKRFIHLIILTFFFGHLLYLDTPFVNLEWVYKAGTQYYTTWDATFLNIYLSNQANPITYSFFSSIFVSLFGDNYINYRLLALFGGCLILISYIKYNSPFLLLMIALNPLVWVYSGRAYSELLSVGLLVLAIELHKSGYIKGIIGGISASVKYHSILFAAPYWGLTWLDSIFIKKEIDFKNTYFISALFSTLVFIIFLISYFYLYDIWIVPDKYKATLALKPTAFLNNFFSYGFYLSALFFVTIPHLLRHTSLKTHLIALSISLPLAIINQDNGEMNFGSLDQILGSHVILLVKIIGFWNFLLCLDIFIRNKKYRVLALTIIFYIAVLSATRPAQRYLLFIIPFWALLISQSDMKLHSLFKWGYISILLCLAIFTSLYQVANAKASEDVMDWSEENNLTINTNWIYPHVGDSPMHSWDSNLSVQIESKENDEVLFKSPVMILGYEIRKYVVVRRKE